MSYRKNEFSRPKPENLDKLGALEKDAAFPTGITTPSSERTSTAASSLMRGENPPGSLKLLMGSQVRENVFTDQPVWGWLILSVFQTFVVIPWMVRRWGKGAYCGWICSCGALAETLGDAHRQKMPHGPFWNRLNMVGQVVLGIALLLFGLRVLGWVFPESFARTLFDGLLAKYPVFNYKYIVDFWLAASPVQIREQSVGSLSGFLKETGNLGQ